MACELLGEMNSEAGGNRRPVSRAYWLLLGLFAALQILDILTTNRALALVPGAIELNPIMALAQSRLAGRWLRPCRCTASSLSATSPVCDRRSVH